MPTHTFTIKAGLCAHESTIEIDGRPLDGVTKVSFELSANNITTLKLEIHGAVVVEGEFRESAILHVDQARLPHG